MVDEHAERLEDVAHRVERGHHVAVLRELVRVAVHRKVDDERGVGNWPSASCERGSAAAVITRALPLADGGRSEEGRNNVRQSGVNATRWLGFIRALAAASRTSGPKRQPRFESLKYVTVERKLIRLEPIELVHSTGSATGAFRSARASSTARRTWRPSRCGRSRERACASPSTWCRMCPSGSALTIPTARS